MATNPSNSNAPTAILRFFCVRHGETEANVQRIVVGQSGSPLTELGIAHTLALGQSPHWVNYTAETSDTTTRLSSSPLPFWRLYASDLPRTRHTMRLLCSSLQQHLQRTNVSLASTESSTETNETTDVHDTVRYDARLREIAKGVRQGYPKDWSYEQALEAYTKAQTTTQTSITDDDCMPLLESHEEAWTRVRAWWHDVIRDVRDDAADRSFDARSPPPHYPVLVVAHAGVLRLWLQRSLGVDRLAAHVDARYDAYDHRLSVPNTSLTILDWHIDLTAAPISDNVPTESSLPDSVTGIDIVLLTSTDHMTKYNGTAGARNTRWNVPC